MPEKVKDVEKDGHIGNLSPEQEGKLKEIWKKFFSAVGDAREKAKKAAESGNAKEEQKKGEGKRPSNKRSITAEPKDKEDAGKGQASAEEEAQGLKDLLAAHGSEATYQAFWQFCLAEDPDALMLRFLRARKWDVEAAFNMLGATLSWRLDTDVAGILAAGEEGLCKEGGIKKNFGTGKAFTRGTDLEGKPIVFAKAKVHKASDQTQEEMLKYIVYQMETNKTLLPLDSGIETSSVVFDLHGLGMGNVDWDTANMVIRVFQSYYPETLGHAVIWNAPTLFSGMWKIVKGMLDPAVKEKIAFASSTKEISEFIDPKHLPKEFGGTSPWKYRFTEPESGENDHMKDDEAKEKRLAAYQSAASAFEDATEKWIGGDSSAGKDRRDKARAFAVRRLDADPYLRGKSVFAREGTVVGDGTIAWKYDHGNKEEFGTSANEWAKELNIEDPPERPLNKDGNEIVLSSDEDTESATDDSEEDILDDPNHHHHNSVAVGFAKFGDGVANKFSKLGKGPSLHEKRKQKREEKHARHEERRQKKLEAKRKRIEAEQAHQEELEEENRKAEESGAMDASYQAYLAKFAQLPVDALSGAAVVATHFKEAAVGVAQEEDNEKAKKETAKAGNAFVEHIPAFIALAAAILAMYFSGSYLVKGGSNALSSKSGSSSVSHVSKSGSVTTSYSASSKAASANKPRSVTETVITSIVTQYVTAGQDASATQPIPAASAPAPGKVGKGKVEILNKEPEKRAEARTKDSNEIYISGTVVNPPSSSVSPTSSQKVAHHTVEHPFSVPSAPSQSDAGDLVKPAFSSVTPSSSGEILGTVVEESTATSPVVAVTTTTQASSAATTLSKVIILD